MSHGPYGNDRIARDAKGRTRPTDHFTLDLPNPPSLVAIHVHETGDLYPTRLKLRPNSYRYTLTTDDGHTHTFDTHGGPFTVTFTSDETR